MYATCAKSQWVQNQPNTAQCIKTLIAPYGATSQEQKSVLVVTVPDNVVLVDGNV